MKYTLQNIARLNDEGRTFELELTPKELKVTPNVKDVKTLEASIYATKVAESAYLVSLELKVVVTILDDHDFKYKTFKKNVSDEIMVSQNEDIESDVEFDTTGSIDFRPIALALYYDAIPTNYSTTKLSKKIINGIEIVSEDEYQASKGNAFSNIEFDVEDLTK